MVRRRRACGEDGPAACTCSIQQNSHQHLRRRVGLEPAIFRSRFETDDDVPFRAPPKSGLTLRGDPSSCGTDTSRPTWRPTAPRVQGVER